MNAQLEKNEKMWRSQSKREKQEKKGDGAGGERAKSFFDECVGPKCAEYVIIRGIENMIL